MSYFNCTRTISLIVIKTIRVVEYIQYFQNYLLFVVLEHVNYHLQGAARSPGRISVTVLVMVMLNHSDQGAAGGWWWSVPLGNCSLVSLVNWCCLAPAVTAAEPDKQQMEIAGKYRNCHRWTPPLRRTAACLINL